MLFVALAAAGASDVKGCNILVGVDGGHLRERSGCEGRDGELLELHCADCVWFWSECLGILVRCVLSYCCW